MGSLKNGERRPLNTSENDALLTVSSVMVTLGLWQVVNIRPPAMIDFLEISEVDADKIYSYMNKSMVGVIGIAGVFALIHGKRGYYIPSIAALLTGTAMYLWTSNELKKKRGLLY